MPIPYEPSSFLDFYRILGGISFKADAACLFHCSLVFCVGHAKFTILNKTIILKNTVRTADFLNYTREKLRSAQVMDESLCMQYTYIYIYIRVPPFSI